VAVQRSVIFPGHGGQKTFAVYPLGGNVVAPAPTAPSIMAIRLTLTRSIPASFMAPAHQPSRRHTPCAPVYSPARVDIRTRWRCRRAREVRPPSRPTSRVLGSRTAYRTEEHTSELQSPDQLVCRLPLEKKNNLHEHYLAIAICV